MKLAREFRTQRRWVGITVSLNPGWIHDSSGIRPSEARRVSTEADGASKPGWVVIRCFGWCNGIWEMLVVCILCRGSEGMREGWAAVGV